MQIKNVRDPTGRPQTLFKLLAAPAAGRPGAEDIDQKSPIAMTHDVKEETTAEAPEGSSGLNHSLSPGLVVPRCVFTVSVGDIRCESILNT